jgi:hypothetical protein
MSIYGKINFSADEVASNDSSATMSVIVQQPGVTAVYIGDSMSIEYSGVPFAVWDASMLSQTIYLGREMLYFGKINQIGYDVTTNGSITDPIPVQIWMGMTTAEDISDNNWLPFNIFTEVFSGTIDISESGDYSVFIPLDTPFDYTANNLVIMVNKKDVAADWLNPTNWLHTNVSPARSLYQSIWDTPNAFDPSVEYPEIGIWYTPMETIPNTFIFFSETYDTDETDVTVVKPVNSLNANYPNPFNPSTTISFNNATAGNVKIDIFNIKGQKVKSLVNDYFAQGSHKVVWNGTDEQQRQVGSGVYFYKMTAENFSDTRKMILMK